VAWWLGRPSEGLRFPQAQKVAELGPLCPGRVLHPPGTRLLARGRRRRRRRRMLPPDLECKTEPNLRGQVRLLCGVTLGC